MLFNNGLTAIGMDFEERYGCAYVIINVCKYFVPYYPDTAHGICQL